jgi:transcriptional regulator with PAS, ATPase and Fis domain
MADSGTLFLDEIGNISMKTQLDLLSVLETKEFTRIGGNDFIRVDFRVICATNKNLEQAIKEETFREDLYYRVNVFTIYLPPLRENRSDIPPLAEHFVKKYAMAMNKRVREILPGAMDLLVRYNWPGNVRELENAIERAMVVAKGEAIREEDLPFQLKSEIRTPASDSLEEVEKFHILNILNRMDWNITHSADMLNIDRQTLYNKIKKYGLQQQ